MKVLLWFVVFAYALIAALLFQLVFLPFIAPSWHAGDGLMVGGDWLKYHREAVKLHDQIVETGWGSWEFRYKGHGISGIMGALYVLTIPRPWVFIPVTAALHATASLLVVLMMLRFVKKLRTAIVATLPFIFFPTALLWIAQPLKDGFSIAGFLVFLYAWFVLLDLIRRREFPSVRLLSVIAAFAAGLGLVWIAREYLVFLYQVLCGAIGVLISLYVFRLGARHKLHLSASILITSALLIALLIPDMLPDTAVAEKWYAENLSAVSKGNTIKRTEWEASRTLPSAIDGLFAQIAQHRFVYLRANQDAGGNIDSSIVFRNASDVLKYIPRAIQLSLLAPFPNQWFTQGDSGDSTVMRWVSSFEMMFAYFMLPFGFFAVWKWRRFPEMWISFLFCGAALVIHPMFVPNVGTLVRLRFPYFMTLVCLGLAAFLTIVPQWIRRVRGLVVR